MKKNESYKRKRKGLTCEEKKAFKAELTELNIGKREIEALKEKRRNEIRKTEICLVTKGGAGYVVCDVKLSKLHRGPEEILVSLIPRTDPWPIELRLSKDNWINLSRDVCTILSEED